MVENKTIWTIADIEAHDPGLIERQNLQVLRDVGFQLEVEEDDTTSMSFENHRTSPRKNVALSMAIAWTLIEEHGFNAHLTEDQDPDRTQIVIEDFEAVDDATTTLGILALALPEISERMTTAWERANKADFREEREALMNNWPEELTPRQTVIADRIGLRVREPDGDKSWGIVAEPNTAIEAMIFESKVQQLKFSPDHDKRLFFQSGSKETNDYKFFEGLGIWPLDTNEGGQDISAQMPKLAAEIQAEHDAFGFSKRQELELYLYGKTRGSYDASLYAYTDAVLSAHLIARALDGKVYDSHYDLLGPILDYLNRGAVEQAQEECNLMTLDIPQHGLARELKDTPDVLALLKATVLRDQKDSRWADDITPVGLRIRALRLVGRNQVDEWVEKFGQLCEELSKGYDIDSDTRMDDSKVDELVNFLYPIQSNPTES